MPMPTRDQRLANYRAPVADPQIRAFMDWRVPHGRRTTVAKCMPTYEPSASERLLDLKLKAKATITRALDRAGDVLVSRLGAQIALGCIGFVTPILIMVMVNAAALSRGF